MTLAELIASMESFVRGEAISAQDAWKIEDALRELFPEDPKLEDFADELAHYRPEGGDYLINYNQMRPNVAYHLEGLRSILASSKGRPE
jgi:hypothetical protein